MQATITEWMFVCITIRTLSYPQRCSLPPFLPPFPLLPLLSLPLPIFGPLSIFFFLCSLSFLCPSLSLLLLLLLPSQGPFYPSADSSGSSVPPPSSLSSYTSVSLPLFPSSALSFRFFTPFLHFTLLPLLSCPSYASTAPSPSSAPLLLPFPLLHLLPLLSLFIPFSAPYPSSSLSAISPSSLPLLILLPHRPLLRLLLLLQNTINRTNLSHTGCNLQTAWRNLSLSAVIRRKERG